MKRLRVGLASFAIAVGVLGVPVTGAEAVSVQQSKIVSDVPAKWTPDVLDDKVGAADSVRAIAQVGNKIIVGGDFHSVRNGSADGSNNGSTVSRNYLFAFDAGTGQVDASFTPVVNGIVNAIAVAPDNTIYVAGGFTTVNGVPSTKYVTHLNVTDGTIVSGWKPTQPSAQVVDVRLSGSRLFLGGDFQKIGTTPRVAFGALNPTTGALDNSVDVALAGIHNPGTGRITRLIKFDVTKQGDRAVILGSFTTAQGLPRTQVAMLSITAGGVSVTSSWNTTGFVPACGAKSYDVSLRDVDFSDDGSYFVEASTGGPVKGTLCDAAARFETYATGTNIQPTWVNYSGGDSYTSVAVTATAVYVGGHNRWTNNDNGSDTAGQGAVYRSGIQALNPINGMPFTWAPTKDRGKAVFEILPTADGLWIGSDTNLVRKADRERIAFFPLAGGTTVPPEQPASLPGSIYLGGVSGTSNTTLSSRTFNGSSAGALSQVDSGSIDWSTVRTAFMVDANLYLGMVNGDFVQRGFSGSTLGSATPNCVSATKVPVANANPNPPVVTPAGCFNESDAITYQTTWHNSIKTTKAMFYDNGRVYYTNGTGLAYRNFEPWSGNVGAVQKTAGAGNVNFSQVGLAFVSGGSLYYTAPNGTGMGLFKASWSNGAVTGSGTLVNGPGNGGVDWSAKAAFLYSGPVSQGNRAPSASIATPVQCSALTCTFDGTGSTDPDGDPLSYSWNFGDGETATGAKVSHTYGGDGTRTVTLTVSDGKLSSTTTTSVAVASAAPRADFTSRCTDLTCSFDASSSSGTGISYAWDFGDGTTDTGVTTSHAYSAPGAYRVALTVKDTAGRTATAAQTVNPATAQQSAIAFRGSNAVNTSSAAPKVTVPSTASAGDTLLLSVSTFGSSSSVSVPAGWTSLGTAVPSTDATFSTQIWSRSASAADPGSSTTLQLAASTKVLARITAYAGTDPSDPVSAVATKLDTAGTAHTTPSVPVSISGSWVVNLWLDKSSTNTGWTGPGTQTVRGSSVNTTGSHLTDLVTDTGTGVAAGTSAGVTATGDAASKTAMWSVVLKPAS